MKMIKLIFKNNGHLRGAIYFTSAFLGPIAVALETWAHEPPKNLYIIAAVIVSSFMAGVISLRAYLDQHLSRVTPAQNNPPTP